MNQSPLKPLHSGDDLNPVKLDRFRQLSNEELIESLRPGEEGALRTRPDGTALNGHHRIRILHERGIDVDALPREQIPKDSVS